MLVEPIFYLVNSDSWLIARFTETLGTVRCWIRMLV